MCKFLKSLEFFDADGRKKIAIGKDQGFRLPCLTLHYLPDANELQFCADSSHVTNCLQHVP